MEDNNRKPGSLFGEDDIRYSVGTVEERWKREMSRRRRLMAKILIPLFVIVVGGGLFTTWKCKVFPFAEEIDWDAIEAEHAEAMKKPKAVETMGFVDAKVKVKVILPDGEFCPDALMTVFHEAADSKPSEFFIEIWNRRDVPKEEVKNFATPKEAGIMFNGSPDIEFKDVNGKSKHLHSITPIRDMCSQEDMIQILNQLHSAAYGGDKPVIDPVEFQQKKEAEHEHAEATKLPDVVPSGEEKEQKDGKKSDNEIVLPLPSMKVGSEQ